MRFKSIYITVCVYVYSFVSVKRVQLVNEKYDKETDKNVIFWINRQLNDPITKIMLKDTHLTEIQLNTLLLDFLSDGFSENNINFERKARLRQIKAEVKKSGVREITKTNLGVSRGAFNRVLKQARKNVIRSIYTIILLGYLGLFEDPRLQQYLELAENIREYSKNYEKAYQAIQNRNDEGREIKEFLLGLQKYLQELIDKLGKTLSLKEKGEA